MSAPAATPPPPPSGTPRKRRPNLTLLAVPAEEVKPYTLSAAGVFSEGDLTMSRAGLFVGQAGGVHSRNQS